jgi:hypothetical protein
MKYNCIQFTIYFQIFPWVALIFNIILIITGKYKDTREKETRPVGRTRNSPYGQSGLTPVLSQEEYSIINNDFGLVCSLIYSIDLG